MLKLVLLKAINLSRFMSLTRCVCIRFIVSRLMVQTLNFVVSQYKCNKQITLWLVCLYDFYSLVVKNR